jgi:hypothetical protein
MTDLSTLTLHGKKTVHTFTQEYPRIPQNTPILPNITLRGPVNIPERPRNRYIFYISQKQRKTTKILLK